MGFENVFDSDLVDYSGDFANQDADYLFDQAESKHQSVWVCSMFSRQTAEVFTTQLVRKLFYEKYYNTIYSNYYGACTDFRSYFVSNPEQVIDDSVVPSALAELFPSYKRDLEELKSDPGIKVSDSYLSCKNLKLYWDPHEFYPNIELYPNWVYLLRPLYYKGKLQYYKITWTDDDTMKKAAWFVFKYYMPKFSINAGPQDNSTKKWRLGFLDAVEPAFYFSDGRSESNNLSGGGYKVEDTHDTIIPGTKEFKKLLMYMAEKNMML